MSELIEIKMDGIIAGLSDDFGKPLVLFNDGRAIEELLLVIESEATATIYDMTDKESRAACKAMARKVASAKTKLDGFGKDLVTDWKTKSKKVDIERKMVRDRLDVLRDIVKAPVLAYEADIEAAITAKNLELEIGQHWDMALSQDDLINREAIVKAAEDKIAEQQAADDLAKREKEIADNAANEATRIAEERIAHDKALETAARLSAEKEEIKRAANVDHQKAVNNEILTAMIDLGIDREVGVKLITEIIKGRINNISINY